MGVGAGGVAAGTGEAEEAEAVEIDVGASAVDGRRDGVRVEAAVAPTRDILAQCHQSSAEPARAAAPAARPSVRLLSDLIQDVVEPPLYLKNPFLK